MHPAVKIALCIARALPTERCPPTNILIDEFIIVVVDGLSHAYRGADVALPLSNLLANSQCYHLTLDALPLRSQQRLTRASRNANLLRIRLERSSTSEVQSTYGIMVHWRLAGTMSISKPPKSLISFGLNGARFETWLSVGGARKDLEHWGESETGCGRRAGRDAWAHTPKPTMTTLYGDYSEFYKTTTSYLTSTMTLANNIDYSYSYSNDSKQQC